MPKRQMHREVFFANNGAGPYLCFLCKVPIGFYDPFPIHHIDNNHDNDAPSNLTAIHKGCHMTLHKTGFRHSDETKALMGRKHRGFTVSAAHREAISKAHRGIPRTQEVKDKISAAQKGRTLSVERCMRMSTFMKAKWATEEGRQEWLRVARLAPRDHDTMALRGRFGAFVRWNKEDLRG